MCYVVLILLDNELMSGVSRVSLFADHVCYISYYILGELGCLFYSELMVLTRY
jgi:hypothetical protein